MATSTDIVRIAGSQYARARLALARAFFDYNLMVYAAPSAERRGPGTDVVYAALLADSLLFGEVYATSDIVGVACWLPPDKSSITLVRQIRAGMLRLPLRFGIKGFRRLVAYDNMAQKLHHDHAGDPHWYLSAIGVEPERQGQGIGGALMQPILERADADRLACYLETHVESNVRLYEKHGFGIARKAEVPGHPIPVWAMLRRPR